MHLMVLGASRQRLKELDDRMMRVSMHLMVLGASRLKEELDWLSSPVRLNAPDGAGCFPTRFSSEDSRP